VPVFARQLAWGISAETESSKKGSGSGIRPGGGLAFPRGKKGDQAATFRDDAGSRRHAVLSRIVDIAHFARFIRYGGVSFEKSWGPRGAPTHGLELARTADRSPADRSNLAAWGKGYRRGQRGRLPSAAFTPDAGYVAGGPGIGSSEPFTGQAPGLPPPQLSNRQTRR